jgi:molybdenum cofactor guanylyltransferase
LKFVHIPDGDFAMTRAGGIVLCGGQSQRMGTSKAWLPIAGEPMLPRVVRLLREVVSPVVVVAAVGQDLPRLPDDIRIVHDEAEARGPLQGLAAGLSALSGQVDFVFVSACDAPLLKPAFVRCMIEALGDHAICVPFVDGYYHPLAAVYRVDALPAIRKLLAEDRRRLIDLFDRMPTRMVEETELRRVDASLESLRNVNTPSELAQALRDLKT